MAQITTTANGTTTPRVNIIVARELGALGMLDSWEEVENPAYGKPVDFRRPQAAARVRAGFSPTDTPAPVAALREE